MAEETAEFAELPWPGDELVFRVAGGIDRASFYQGGQQSVRDIEAVLGVVGRRLDSYPEILDFGCGCGRILLWLEHVAKTCTLHGTDIDQRAVRWAQEHVPWANLSVNQPLPPLGYADASFDLVFNHSVFTHLDEMHQDQWLAELRRVTKPGGHLVLSVHGEAPLVRFEELSRKAGGNPALVREQVERDGIAFIEHDSFAGGPFPESYHSTFHAPWYVFEHWGRFFDVKAYVPNGSLGYQDFVLLERPPAGQPIKEAPPVARRPAPAPAPVERPPRLPAVERAVAHPLLGPALEAPARYGQLTRAARKAILRVLSHLTEYQAAVDRGVQQALKELDEAVTANTAELDRIREGGMVHGVMTLNESAVRLWDSLQKHGERLNRLESDLWEELSKKADRPADPGGRP